MGWILEELDKSYSKLVLDKVKASGKTGIEWLEFRSSYIYYRKDGD